MSLLPDLLSSARLSLELTSLIRRMYIQMEVLVFKQSSHIRPCQLHLRSFVKHAYRLCGFSNNLIFIYKYFIVSEEITGRSISEAGAAREDVVIATKLFYPSAASTSSKLFH